MMTDSQVPILEDTSITGLEIELPDNNSKSQSLFKNGPLMRLLFYILITFTASASVTIVMPSIAANYFGGCLDTKGNSIDDDCEADFVKFNLWSNIFDSIGGLLQFLFLGLIGRLTDSYGRKPFMIINIILFMIPRLFMTFYVDVLIYYILYLPVAVVSSYTTLPPFVSGFVADILSEKQRTSAYGLAYAAQGVSTLFGAGYALIIAAIFDNFAIFPSLMVFYGLDILYTQFFIKESLSKENRKPFTASNYNPFKPLLYINKTQLILWCVVESLFFGIIESAVTSSAIGYILHELDLDGDDEVNQVVAILMVAMGISAFICNSVILPKLKKCGFTNLKILLFIQCITVIVIIQFFMIGILKDDYYKTIQHVIMYSLTGTAGLLFMHSPVISGIITQCVVENEQGVIFGMLSAYKGIINIITPWSFAYLYSYLSSDELELGYALFPLLFVFLIMAFLVTIFPFKNAMVDWNQSVYLIKTNETGENYGSQVTFGSLATAKKIDNIM